MSMWDYTLCPFHGATCVRETLDTGDVEHHTAYRQGYDGGAAASSASDAAASASAAAASASAATASAAATAAVANTAAPPGSIVAYGGSSAPTGWLLCDGTAVSRTTYSSLFTAIGTTFGTGDGSTTFNVPDLRQRFPLGKAASGTGSTLGGSGGQVDHTHDAHTVGNNALGALAGNVLEAPTTHAAANAPFLSVQFIVKT